MITITSLNQIPKRFSSSSIPLGLTIGNFDGVHLGHKHLLKELRKRVTDQGIIAVLSFKNPPQAVINQEDTKDPLCSLEEKIERLKKEGVDLLILLHFSKELAEISYKNFIINIRENYPFTQLVLGKGAAFGKDRLGNASRIKKLGLQMGFEAHYLTKIKNKNTIISSGRIRKLLEKGDKKRAAELLGK